MWDKERQHLRQVLWKHQRRLYTARARPPLGSSDHNTVYLLPTYRSVFKSNKPTKKTVHVWSRDSTEELKGCFLWTDWDIFLEDADINSATESITAYISFCVDSIVPQKNIVIYPNNKPYVTREINECIKKKKVAFLAGDTGAMKEAQKELNRQMRDSRRKHKERAELYLARSNTKKLWDSIREMTNMRADKKPIAALDESAKANELNAFFLRFECDTSQGCHDVVDSLNCDEHNRFVIDLDTVYKAFKTIKTNKATGPDGMHASLLKMCAAELSPAWHSLFQLSLDSHRVPELWKKSVLVPVPKKTCPSENNDYRPVAITSNVVKTLEKILVEVVRKDVEPSLDQHQFAYARNRSTCDAISTVAHFTLKHLERNDAYARMLFIDFSSAFNSIHPDILLGKLALMGVNPFVIRWYLSFLCKRPQRVRFNSVLSEEALSSTGVPQGTVSSSFLFTLYTNDCVSSYPNQYVVKFSDDTVILSLLTSKSNLLSHTAGVDRFAEWCGLNHLMINTKKTEEIIIDPRSIGDHTVISVNSNNISQVSSYKYLGVHIDQDMRWHTHVTSCCAKIHQRLHFLSFHSETKVVWSRYEYYVFLQGEH